MADEAPSLRVVAARATLSAVLLAAPLLVGSVHPLVLGCEAVLLCLAAAMAVGEGERRAPLSGGRLGLVFAAAVAWTALQLAPLPGFLLRVLSPRAHATWISGPLLTGRSWAPLTLDRSATAGALAFGIALAAAYACARHAWRTRDLHGARGPLRAIGISAVLAAVVAVAHRVAGAQRVFGVYRPIAQHTALVSLPVVNPNHLAAVTNLGALACLGLALEEGRREARTLWLAGAVFCAVTTLLTLSRGGIVALTLGAAFFLVRTRTGRSSVAKVAIALAAIVASVGGYLAQDRLRAEVAGLFDLGQLTAGSKLGVMADAGRMALRFPLTGAGRGCFRFGFPRFDRQGGHWAFSHPENLPLQLATEWGIPFALFFLVVCGAAWIGAARRHAGAIRSAALAGVGAVVVQNLVDFSLEIGAVAIPTAACLAVIATPRSERKVTTGPRRSTLFAAAWIVAAATALVAGIFSARYGAEAAGEALRRRASARAGSARTLVSAGMRAMRSHPADAYLPIQIARGLVRTRPREALRYLNRALWLDPHAPAAHLLTGRALLRLGRIGQATLHYRAAVRWDPVESRVVAAEVASRIHDPALALRLVPSGAGGEVVLRALAEAYLGREETATAVTLARALVRRSPRGDREHAFLARVLVGAGRSDEAIAAARRARGTDAECEGAFWESAALEQVGRRADEKSVLERAARICPEDARLRERLLWVAVELGDFRTAQNALAMYRGIVGPSGEAWARGHYLEGRLERARHHDARAAAAFQRAAELEPRNAEYLEAARAAWESIGRPDRAEALQRALARLPR